MAQVDIVINGREYRIACEDGQEAHLKSLAGYIDDKIGELVGAVGQVGDTRLMVMASLLVADELSDTVRALYRESRSRRIDEAAAAAAVAVDGLVAIATLKGNVAWTVEPSGPCGPDCADNALAGDISAGGEFPTGDSHPPAHPACTCWLVAADN